MLPKPARMAERISWRSSTPFVVCHFIPLAAVFTGVTARAVVLGVVLYVTRVLCITAGYHRLLAHRAYRANRLVTFLVAFGGTTAVQRGPLWWAAHHRDHHRYADSELDPHSPTKGFWWSHVGWVLSGEYSASNHDRVPDLARYPELVFIDRHDWIGPWALGIASFLVAGWSGLVVGFFGSTVLLWHATFAVNSLSHVQGRRRYGTADTSRNNVLVAVLTAGEGWHNNHHHYPTSARQGFAWYEVDPAYWVLRVAAALHVVRDLKPVPDAARSSRRLTPEAFDPGRCRQHLVRAAQAVPGGDGELTKLLETAYARAGQVRSDGTERVPASASSAPV